MSQQFFRHTLSMLKALFAVSCVTLSMSTPGQCMDNQFNELRTLMGQGPAQAQKLESQGKIAEAQKIYEQMATLAGKVEDQPRKIYSASSFAMLAEFLERQGQLDKAMEWYDKLATMPVNGHAYTVKGNSMLRYSALLRKRGDKKKADKIQSDADEMIGIQKKLNTSGCDY